MTKVHTARALTTGVMTLAVAESFIHIVTTFDALGAGWDKWTAPFLIDTVAVVGKICTDPAFSAPTRRAGRSAFWFAGIISLICNVAAGWLTHHFGSMVIGVIVVSAALWGETMIAKIAPRARRPRTTAAPAAPAQPAKDPAKVAAARKAAETRAARKAAAAAETVREHPAMTEVRSAWDERQYI